MKPAERNGKIVVTHGNGIKFVGKEAVQMRLKTIKSRKESEAKG